MRVPYLEEVAALRRPIRAFGAVPPSLGQALGTMLALWTPPALANALLSVWGALRVYGSLRAEGPPPGWAQAAGLDPESLRQVLMALPPAPAFGQVWPWLLPAVPLGLLGTWLHHAVWDHTALWMLGGLKGRQGFRASLLAEAQALRMATPGSLAGLLGFLPGLGPLLAGPLLLFEGYLWIFRGFALAARHSCEPWRGVVATLVHAGLFGAFVLVSVLLSLGLLRTGL